MKMLSKPIILTIISSFIILSSCGTNNNFKESKTTNNLGSSIIIKKEPQTLSTGTQDIIKLQIKNGPETLLKVDCNKYDSKGKSYCENEKKKINEWKNEITWGSIFSKGNDYIKSYDCNKIKLDEGKKECEDYKKNINTNSNSGSLKNNSTINSNKNIK